MLIAFHLGKGVILRIISESFICHVKQLARIRALNKEESELNSVWRVWNFLDHRVNLSTLEN